MAQPWLFGAAHVTAALWSPRVATTPVGASGTPHGTTAADGGDHAPQSARLRARTWNCCGCPLGRLDQRSEVPVVVLVAPDDRSCTWYSITGSPPLPGAPQPTVMNLSPRSPTGAAGASGGRSGWSGGRRGADSPPPLGV